ncbi:NAD(P)H-binding protein [Yinghuangia sp. YIM S09857]|uniref:NAD(P)H-binding protein n=1 Tax=Yinghuangia sp. YIM S09857 TaxID=3436929 RepID=UPI003F53920D
MPVVVIGADRPLGRALVLALVDLGVPELRAVVRDRSSAPALRAAGVRVSVGDLSDPLRLGAVLEGAHTAVHLDAGPDGSGEPLDTWDWLLEAAEDTGLQRIVTVVGDNRVSPDTAGYDVVCLPGRVTRSSGDATDAVDPVLVSALIEADRRR